MLQGAMIHGSMIRMTSCEVPMMRADDVLRQFRLDGAVAAITGGARGIGRATAELFAAAGARVAILHVDYEAAQAAAAHIGGSAAAYQVDVGSEGDVKRVFEGLLQHEGRLDI